MDKKIIITYTLKGIKEKYSFYFDYIKCKKWADYLSDSNFLLEHAMRCNGKNIFKHNITGINIKPYKQNI